MRCDHILQIEHTCFIDFFRQHRHDIRRRIVFCLEEVEKGHINLYKNYIMLVRHFLKSVVQFRQFQNRGNKMLLTTLTFVTCVLLSLSAHELFHAFFLRECGIHVTKIGLIGMPGLGSIELPIRHRLFPGTRWFLHPFIIGAYFEANDTKIKYLTQRERLFIHGGGPLGSICYAALLLGLAMVLVAVTTTVVLLAGGVTYFRRMEGTFADVI